MKYLSFLLSVVLTMSFFLQVTAQDDYQILGTVRSASSKKPLENALVELEELKKITLTSSEGKFTFSQIPPGQYSLRVSHLGFREHRTSVTLAGNQKVSVEILLQEEAKFIEGVEVKGDLLRSDVMISSAILPESLERSSAHDVGGLLLQVPNLSAIKRGGTSIDPVLRGFRANQLNVLIDGFQKIEGGCPNRMDPATAHLTISDLSEVRVMKGPHNLRYGPVMGGIVQLNTSKARPFETFQLRLKAGRDWKSNWNGNTEYLIIHGGDRRIFFAVAGTRQIFGDYQSGDGKVIPSSFRKYGYSLELGVVPAKNHEARFTYKGTFGRDMRFPALPMDERIGNTHLMSAQYRYSSSSKVFKWGEFQLYRSQVYHEMDNKWRSISDTVVSISKVDAINQGFRIQTGWDLIGGSLIAGVDFEQIDKDGQRIRNFIMQPNLPVRKDPLWKNARITNGGIFADYQMGLGPSISLLTSFRGDYNKATSDPLVLKNMAGSEVYRNDTVASEFYNVSFSVGMRHRINPNTAVKLLLGRGVRSPNMIERFIVLLPIGYDRFDYLGNPELKPEKNHQIDVGLDKTTPFGCHLSANLFLAYVTDFITGEWMPPSAISPQSPGVLGVKRFVNIPEAYLYGFEAEWQSPPDKKWNGYISVAYTAGINPSANGYIIENGQITGVKTIRNDPLPEIPPLESRLRWEYLFRRPELTPGVEVRLVAPQKLVSEAFGEKVTPGFVIPSIYLKYTYNAMISVNAGVNNLFNKYYYEHLNRVMIGSTNDLPEPGRVFYLNLNISL